VADPDVAGRTRIHLEFTLVVVGKAVAAAHVLDGWRAE